METVAALRKQFLGQPHLSPARLQAVSRALAAARQFRSASAEAQPNRVHPLCESLTLARAGLRRADRKRYRTRFGFAEGAYLAIGPPPSALAADLG